MNKILFKGLPAMILLLFLLFEAKGQQLEGALGVHGFTDNREYAPSGRFSQTIFGIRVAPEVGFLVDSVHRVRVGINALHEFGSRPFVTEVVPVAYYQYTDRRWDFFIGAFPRFGLLDDYPRALLIDTLHYYRPNVEGMLAKAKHGLGWQTVWIDWTSRQTDVDRETFLFGLSGLVRRGIVYSSHYAYMFHNAGPGIPIPGDNVQDNGAALFRLGLDLSRKTILDSLTVSGGGMMSFERLRNVTDWQTPTGLLLDLHAQYRRFGVANTFYAGQGHNLIYGDPFYTAKRYNRVDLSWAPILLRNIEGRFVFTFHFVEGVVDNQQAFLLRYRVSGPGRRADATPWRGIRW
ncbi:hypothetical protein BH24BAC1_BH24BAC1_16120 [soil metagenome]